MERNEWSICSWLSSLNVRVVAKCPRRTPSFRMVVSPRAFRSVAPLLKPAISVSFSSIVTRSENIERPTFSSDKYHKCFSRTDLATVPCSLTLDQFFQIFQYQSKAANLFLEPLLQMELQSMPGHTEEPQTQQIYEICFRLPWWG